VADVFLGAQGVLYQGEGVKPTLAVSYFHRVYDGGARNSTSGARATRFCFWRARTSRAFTTTRMPS
jgi:hypothetical protein